MEKFQHVLKHAIRTTKAHHGLTQNFELKVYFEQIPTTFLSLHIGNTNEEDASKRVLEVIEDGFDDDDLDEEVSSDDLPPHAHWTGYLENCTVRLIFDIKQGDTGKCVGCYRVNPGIQNQWRMVHRDYLQLQWDLRIQGIRSVLPKNFQFYESEGFNCVDAVYRGQKFTFLFEDKNEIELFAKRDI